MHLSIVIPVYRVEKYIRQTLESIYCQAYDENDFEVVLVNNGTPDNSMCIVEEFAAKHHNLHISTIEVNRGLSLGRNRGINDANGDFIWHVDSDDTISKSSLQYVCELLRKHKDVDIFGFDIMKVREDNGTEQKSTIIPSDKNSYYNRIVSSDIICPFVQGPVQRFIFKRDFVEKNNLYFYPEIQHEDMEYLPKAYYFAQNVFISDIPIYRYLLRKTGSLTASLSPKSYPDRIRIINLLESYKIGKNDSLLDIFNFWIAFFLLSPDRYTVEHRSDFVNFIKKNKSIIRKTARRGIKALWHYKEYKRIPLAILLFVSPLLVYFGYYRKGIEEKQQKLNRNGKTT